MGWAVMRLYWAAPGIFQPQYLSKKSSVRISTPSARLLNILTFY